MEQLHKAFKRGVLESKLAWTKHLFQNDREAISIAQPAQLFLKLSLAVSTD